MQLFHYHLVTSKVRLVEARYIGKLGFDLISDVSNLTFIELPDDPTDDSASDAPGANRERHGS